jgi:Zn/Cd-binding protein ZinT
MKTYSAQTGYVYQYYYEGHRPFRAKGDAGVEFVFRVSADRKAWNPVVVRLADGTIGGWQAAHSRELSSTEQYAIAKMALFQAFDERPAPADMKDEVNVRRADLETILDTLDL